MKLGFKTISFFLCLNLFQAAFALEHFAEEINVSTFPNHTYGYSAQVMQDGIDISFNTLKTSFTDESQKVDDFLFVNVSCDKKVQINRSLSLTLKGKNLSFNIYDHKVNAGKANLVVLEKDTHCDLNFKIQNELKTIKIYPFNSNLKNLWAKNDSNADVEDITNLADGVEAINKRIEILTGSKISNNLIEARDPAMKLDFSKMPKYDFILFTTLQFNNDYVSNIMFKALAAHAKAGTPVVVVGNTRLIGEKEQNLLDWLQAQSPLIKIMKYEYYPDNMSVSGKIDKIHRVSHVKTFLTYSKDHPELNHLIFGGRNNSDRYFFPEFKRLVDPQYTQFDKELLNSWAYFFDLEFYVKSPKMVKVILTPMMKYLKLDSLESQMAESQSSDELKYTISIPYKDNQVLEKEYVAAIDKAHRIIRILSPYIYFTDDIDAAFKRAFDRGVRIEAITSASLIGDDMTKAIKGVYDKFTGQRRHYINTYAYTSAENTVMHRKAMMIDEQILMLGSVNLSKRSFYHDVEDNFTITNKDIIESFLETYNKEIAKSTLIVKDINESFIGSVLEALDQDDML